MKSRILIVEDEPTIATLISYNLKKSDYETTVIHNGLEAIQMITNESFDLVLLDVMLPGMNGFEVIQSIRKNGVFIPVIILTARNAEEEIVQGLVNGADDYMTKPFAVGELLARVQAVLRRSNQLAIQNATMTEQVNESNIQLGDLIIYPDKYEVLIGDKSISLRPKEFQVLIYMTKRLGKIITRDELMNEIWGFDYFGEQRTVDVHVSSLRKKLEMSQNKVFIDAVRGVGYKLIVK